MRANRIRNPSQAGFTLAALLVILSILALVLAFTVPRMWSDVLRRERDYQTVFVMKQYARAIAEFQKTRGALPVSLDQLKEQNSPRVLRQLYPDPLTGAMDWILIPPGAPAAVPTPSPGSNPAGGIRVPSVPSVTPTPSPSPAVTPGGSPDYVGPFVGVRPPVNGQAYIALNGQDRYEGWSYTIQDLQRETNPAQGGAGSPNTNVGPPPKAPPTKP